MFSENFERICSSRGIKPGPLCVKAGLKAGRAANWKNTGALPKEHELLALAKALECRVSDFFREDGEMAFSSREEAMEYWMYVDAINPFGGKMPDLNDDENNFVTIYRKCKLLQQTKLMLLVYQFAEDNGIEYEES